MSANVVNLTDKELQYLGLVWQCLKNPIEVDMEKLARISNYKTKASANTAYHKLKNKILAAGKATSSAAETSDAKADSDDVAAPAPTTKKARGKKAAVKAEDSDDDDEDDEVVKLAAKPKVTKKGESKPAAKATAAKSRSTRAAGKAKDVIKDESEEDEDEDEEIVKPLRKSRSTKSAITNDADDDTAAADWKSIDQLMEMGKDANRDADKIIAANKGLKRGVTETSSDIIDEHDNKRVKAGADAVEGAAEPSSTLADTEGDTTAMSTDLEVTNDTVQTDEDDE